MNRYFVFVLFFCLFETVVFAQDKKAGREECIVIGPKFSTTTSGISLSPCRKQVVYFPAEMYEQGMLEAIEFSFTKPSSEKGDTVGNKMPILLKIYARNTEKNIPGDELLKDTIIIIPPKKNQKIKIDISKYGIVLPSEGFYCGFEAFSTDWYVKQGYLTMDNLSYQTKFPIGGNSIFHSPMIEATTNKKEVKKYQNYLLGGWAYEWTNVNEKYNLTLIIRLHIRT